MSVGEIISLPIVLILGLIIGYCIAKKINDAHFKIHEEQAKAKAKAIEYEAEKILQNADKVLENAKTSETKIELRYKKTYEELSNNLQKDFNFKLLELEKKEHNLCVMQESFNKEKQVVEQLQIQIADEKQENLKLKEYYDLKTKELLKTIENVSGLTQEEAKELVLNNVKEQSRAEIAHIVRKYEEEAKSQAKAKAGYILAQATTRYAGEYVSERLISVINLKSDDLKGRIIGKEGRNIKTLEMVLGVDVIIDDTPNAIIISSFNVLRRAIAKKVIELLIEDGRIQPARIEELHERVSNEFEEEMFNSGQEVVMDLGLTKMAPELIRLIGRLKYRASYGQNALTHSLEVAHLAGIIADECGGNARLARRAGILHDIGKALTHDYEGSHVDLGAMICKRHKEHAVVLNAIYAHHGHEEATSIEAAAVCTADVLSAARPGARREVLEAFLKRVSDLEEIAKKRTQVKKAYAINAGREIRIIVNAKLINDDESILLAKEIAQEIESNMQFPGEVKVNVIRETRAVEIAK
ncbi:ribonuclease Y [Campylobacter canadensis]|uniref:Ribonuclease Y n=1 Tax=Campylobacter canadensis TaxID=449520 RepID=A0ABS7WP51_9BACT|nr:ribonuclease Y [Campylobacter canadensis]MBZ7986546.1 ribonuclease Y [Campylobacter canadensis]MBZ7995948.1 ribonuclease Y [Campylobacter canadensis]MBZ7997582.1 ribonuclease Y [Campylobacter canadensis]MBZ7999380.1 ribonuclease Y [Campylobacter canadensis]MBZ8001177.1 ribonuclease Y [Campylobacter canadensis]